MLPQEVRLRKKGEFRKIYEQGRKYYGKYLILFVIKKAAEINRYGIVASKKVGKAVVRNRSRRQIREIVRETRGNMLTGNDIILVIKSSAVGVPFADLQEDYAALCRKARLC
ncbi:MAG: ribonuclease P protein component [Methylocystaceae bacterium]